MTDVLANRKVARQQLIAAALFAGPGEMRAICRERDWSATPLGPVETWPVSLRSAAQMVLGAGSPMLLFWGPELVQIFNDRFRPSLGEDVDLLEAVGAPGALFWSEVWAHRGPQIEHVMQGGEPVEHADVLIPMTRNGKRDEVWWSWVDSPLFGDDGRIAGVLVSCQETTTRVRESRHLAYAFQHAPSFLAVMRGPDYVFEQVNEAYYQVVGHRELIGKPVLEALPEVREQGFVEALLDRVRLTNEPFIGRETPILLARTPGAPPEQRYIDFIYLPLLEDNGEYAGVIAHGTDVTEQVEARRAAERLLGESERARLDAEQSRNEADLTRRRLETLLEHLPVGVTMAEAPSGRLLVSNAAVGRIWGLDTPAAKVAEYSAIYVGFRPGPGPESERQYASEQWPLARALTHGEIVTDEMIEIGWPDGSRRTVSVSAAPVRDASGALIGGVVMTQDVHEREQLLIAERAARERTERLQSLTASLAAARTMDDVASVVVAGMVEALGARTGSLAVLDEEARALMLLRTVGFPDSALNVVRTQSLDLNSPLVDCFHAQSPIWIETRSGPDGLDVRYPIISPIWDILGVGAGAFLPLVAAGRPVGAISFGYEGPKVFAPAERAFLSSLGQQAALAVERARLFDAEHAARAEAERANKAKSEFLAIMSHELRTPLNAIDGYAELMELGIRGPLTDEQRQDLARIRKSEKHLLGLINGVLNYAQVEAGAVQYEMEPVPLDEVMATCEALVMPQVRASELTLLRESWERRLMVLADREKLQQVLLNLLSNAVKFTHPGGRIGLRCERGADPRGPLVRIMVADTGIGIPDSQLARIFEPFVQVDSELTRTREGTGLGLAISRDLARGMGGDLTVESTAGVGSTFALTLRAG